MCLDDECDAFYLRTIYIMLQQIYILFSSCVLFVWLEQKKFDNAVRTVTDTFRDFCFIKESSAFVCLFRWNNEWGKSHV